MRERFADLNSAIEKSVPQTDDKEFIKNLTKKFSITYEDSDEDEIDISET